jgi:hypothetical protein
MISLQNLATNFQAQDESEAKLEVLKKRHTARFVPM